MFLRGIRAQGWRPSGRVQSARHVREELERLHALLSGHQALLEAINHRAALLEDINHMLVMSPAQRRRPSRPRPEMPADVVAQLRLPAPAQPQATVVVPVHGERDFTLNCLWSLARADTKVPFDVVVVDDASPGALGEELPEIKGLRLLRLSENHGFISACNAGVAQVSAPFVVLLNNDTEVHEWWLDALVAKAKSDDRIAIVGAMLLDASGAVQDAGGIVWSDGEASNYGRNASPDDFAYGWSRDVDYCTGACILVRRTFWSQVGGFDGRFTPAYYEDTDLAFQARANGWRVVYEPAARVTHFEGVSHGTDVTTGVKSYQVRNRTVFKTKWAHELRQQFDHDADHLMQARDTRRGGHIVVIDHIVPEPDRDAGSLRMRNVLELLVDEGFVVHFIADNLVGSEPYTEDLQRLGIEVVHGPVDPFDVLRSLGPDLSLVLLSRPGVAWRYLPWAREHCPDVPVVFDMVDAHGLRERRRAATSNHAGVERAAEAWDRMERALAQSADLTIAVSDADARHLTRIAGEVPSAVLPTIYRPRPAAVTVDGRTGLLFVGGFRHHPNVRAALDLVRYVVPLVEANMGTPVPTMIVGPDAPIQVQRLASADVTVTGWVRDIVPLQRASRVFVAPLAFGAGVKGKVCESLIAGLPVVTTSIGAEGLDVIDGEHVLIGDEPQTMADHIGRLLTDDDLWLRLSRAGKARAEELVGFEAGRQQLRRILADLNVVAPDRTVPPPSR